MRNLFLDCFNSLQAGNLFTVFVPVNFETAFSSFHWLTTWTLNPQSSFLLLFKHDDSKMETEENTCEILLSVWWETHQSVFISQQTNIRHFSIIKISSLQITTDVLTAAMMGNQTRVLIKLQTEEQTFLTRHKSKQPSNTSIRNNWREIYLKSKMSKTGLNCSLQTVVRGAEPDESETIKPQQTSLLEKKQQRPAPKPAPSHY